MVLPSLKHGKYFSSRLLVQFPDYSGNITMGQIYTDGNVYKGVKFFEKFISGKIFTFNINNTFCPFQNYTLTHANSEIDSLSPTLAPMTAHFNAIDFQALTHLYPAMALGFEDFYLLLELISESHIIRNQLINSFGKCSKNVFQKQ